MDNGKVAAMESNGNVLFAVCMVPYPGRDHGLAGGSWGLAYFYQKPDKIGQPQQRLLSSCGWPGFGIFL